MPFLLYFQGLNFQLAAVLLSLGVYTYVEYGKYSKVSSNISVFNANLGVLM